MSVMRGCYAALVDVPGLRRDPPACRGRHLAPGQHGLRRDPPRAPKVPPIWLGLVLGALAAVLGLHRGSEPPAERRIRRDAFCDAADDDRVVDAIEMDDHV